jgi:hypothetical protein
MMLADWLLQLEGVGVNVIMLKKRRSWRSMVRFQRHINLRYDVDVCSDLYFFVQLDDVGVVHPETAMRDGAAD